MNPQAWLERAFGSASSVRILRELARDPGRVWTGRELAARIRMSPNTVSRTLAELEAEGVVEVTKVGASHAVRLRRRLARDLASIFAVESRPMARVYEAIRRALPPGARCYVYGSTARGDARGESDLDLLVVAPEREAAVDALSRVVRRIHGEFPARVQGIALSEASLRRRSGSPLIQAILREGRVVRGGGRGRR